MTKIRKKSAVKSDVRTPFGTDQQIDESRSGKHINHEKSSGQSGSHGCPCVYILECKDGTLYTGWTNDMAKRLKTHNEGKGAKYTRARLPVTLAYYEAFETKEEAMRREWEIKQLSRKEKEKLIL